LADLVAALGALGVAALSNGTAARPSAAFRS